MSDPKILIVDDDQWILSCFERMLGRCFNLETALGPLQALKTVATDGPYAVVLSDMRMPVMNGLDMLAKMKEISPSTVGLILTGYAGDEMARSIKSGVLFKLIEKPCPLDQLKVILEEALAKYEEKEGLNAG
ncbi:MAG TPA: response regulator [Terriglobia bacterium]|nr:response regulator [Terriglobia bacterium]